jgi:uncharacterized protein YkwD
MTTRMLVSPLVAMLAVAVGTLSSAGGQASAGATARVGPLAFPAQALLRGAGANRNLRFSRTTTGPTERQSLKAYAKLPLSLVPNRGQLDGRVRYAAQVGGANFYFTGREAVFAFATRTRGLALRLGFRGANPHPAIDGFEPASGRVNYLIGNDRARWCTNVPTYGGVVYRDLWPDIDLRFRGVKGRLKYEFLVRPGARVDDIRLAYRGADGLSVDNRGNLVIKTALGKLIDTRPVSYQLIGGDRVPVATRFVAKGTSYRFQIAAHDHSRPLVIDPGLVYSTFLGGLGQDTGNGIAVDPRGNAYVAGITQSALTFPVTAGAYDTTYNGQSDPNFGGDTFITKLNKSGTALVYSTYLGGTSDEPYWAASITVDPAGYAYVAGTTWSADFPTTPGAFDTTWNGPGYDAFVTKLNREGSDLVYSTFLGGSGFEGPYYADAITLDPRGNAYVTGFTDSSDFPTKNAFDPTFNGPFDAFLTKLNRAGSDIVYSTYLGGSDDDDATGVAVDSNGQAFVAGYTASTDFPTKNAIQPANAGGYDAFVTEFTSAGNALVFSTYLGGSDFDFAAGVDVAYAGNAATAVVAGSTPSTDFPTTPGAFDESYNGGGPLFCGDAFITRFDKQGASLVYSTFVGDTLDECVNNVAVDHQARAHIVGFSDSAAYPTTPGAVQATNDGTYDVVMTKLNRDGTGLAYSTYLGGLADDIGIGIAVDWPRKVYLSGDTFSPNFDTTPGAYDTTFDGGGPWYGDAFVTKLDVGEKTDPPFAQTADSDQAERDELAHLNSLRASALLPPLTLNVVSSDVARKHSADQLARGDLNEQGSDGSTPAQRLRAAGVLFTVNAESNGAAVAPTAAGALAAIEADPLLTVNALNPLFKQVGIGVLYIDGVMLLTADFTG